MKGSNENVTEMPIKNKQKTPKHLFIWLGPVQNKWGIRKGCVRLRGSLPNNMHVVSAELRVFGLTKLKETIDNRFPSPKPKSCRTRGVGGWRHDAQPVPLAQSSPGYTGIGYQNCFSTPSLVGRGGSSSWAGEQQSRRTTPKYSMRWPGKPAPEQGFKDGGLCLVGGMWLVHHMPWPCCAPVTSCITAGKQQGSVRSLPSGRDGRMLLH